MMRRQLTFRSPVSGFNRDTVAGRQVQRLVSRHRWQVQDSNLRRGGVHLVPFVVSIKHNQHVSRRWSRKIEGTIATSWIQVALGEFATVPGIVGWLVMRRTTEKQMI